jgi:hypothetical protein
MTGAAGRNPIRRVEFVASVKEIAEGKGGYWEDRGYEWYAGI